MDRIRRGRPPLRLRACCLLFSSDGFLLVRGGNSERTFSCAVEVPVLGETRDVQEHVQSSVNSLIQTDLPRHDDVPCSDVLLATALPDEPEDITDVDKGDRFLMIFYSVLRRTLEDLEPNAVELHTGSALRHVSECLWATPHDHIDCLLENAGTASSNLAACLSAFHPLLPALQDVAKRTPRAYPAGSVDPRDYTRKDLEDFALLDPVLYTFDTQGKGVRAGCVSVLSRKFALSDSDSKSMKACIERFHEASLVIDDIEDESLLRRNSKCAYLQYGTPMTLNAAYLCVFKMLDSIPELFERNHDQTRQLMLRGFVAAHQGQGWDLYWREHRCCPSEKEYIQMIRGKTSTPFVMVACLFFLHSTDRKLMLLRFFEYILALFASVLVFVHLAWLLNVFDQVTPRWVHARDGSRTDSRARMNALIPPSPLSLGLQSSVERSIAHLFDQIGVFFQIRDDYINLTSSDYWKKKGFCDDLHERKFSFPVICMVKNRLGKYRELMQYFAQEEELRDADLHAMLSLVQETSALQYTKQFLLDLREEIQRGIQDAGLSELNALVMQRLTIE